MIVCIYSSLLNTSSRVWNTEYSPPRLSSLKYQLHLFLFLVPRTNSNYTGQSRSFYLKGIHPYTGTPFMKNILHITEPMDKMVDLPCLILNCIELNLVTVQRKMPFCSKYHFGIMKNETPTIQCTNYQVNNMLFLLQCFPGEHFTLISYFLMKFIVLVMSMCLLLNKELRIE